MPKTTGRGMRNNTGALEECSQREINGVRCGKRERKQRKQGGKESVFHGELRTEALLCWQPEGADKTPGRLKEKRMTGGANAQR